MKTARSGRWTTAAGEWVSLSGGDGGAPSRPWSCAASPAGALDLTAYSAVKAWGLYHGEYRVPGEGGTVRSGGGDRLYSGGAGPGWAEGPSARRDGAGPGAVAKGYAGARLAERLRGAGVTSALLNLGGNVQTVGGKPDGSPGRWGGPGPGLGAGGQPAGHPGGGSGCGHLRQLSEVFSAGRTDLWHILDPKTAAPARTGLASVTVGGAGRHGVRRPGYRPCSCWVRRPGSSFGVPIRELDVQVIWVREDGSVALTEGLEEDYRVNPQRQDLESNGGGGMKKRTALLAAPAGAWFCCAASVIWWQRSGPGGGVLARVYQRGELVERSAWTGCGRPTPFPADRGGARKTWWRWSRGGSGSSCYLSRPGVRPPGVDLRPTVPVVCLPNQVIVEIVGVRALWTGGVHDGARRITRLALLTAIA